MHRPSIRSEREPHWIPSGGSTCLVFSTIATNAGKEALNFLWICSTAQIVRISRLRKGGRVFGGRFSVFSFQWSVVGGCLCLTRSVTVAARWVEVSGSIAAGNSRPARVEPRTPGTSRFQDEPQTDRSLSDSNSARNSRYEACTPDSSEICGSQPVSRIRLISHSFLGVPSGLLVSCRISP